MHYDWYFNPFPHFLLVTDELYIERFSNECHKTETKVITLSSHNGNKTQSEPIINRSKYKSFGLRVGKHVRASHDWVWFYI